MAHSKLSFGYLALRMGILDEGDLRRAQALGATSGAGLEAVLVAHGLMTPELAAHVHDALQLARVGWSGTFPAV